MRYLLLSDLHANLEATLAVMEAARARDFDGVLVLGDLVGYGASPNEVVTIVRNLAPVGAIRGNHDKVVSGIDKGEGFNPLALEAAWMNRRALLPEHRQYLAELPRGPLRLQEGIAIAHGTPQDEDEYLVTEADAARVFDSTSFWLCGFGHTHIAGMFALKQGKVTNLVPGGDDAGMTLQRSERYLINPGSVGQPRDEDPRASYALFDSSLRRISFHRVEYPIQRARERMRAAGLPDVLGERLQRGI